MEEWLAIVTKYTVLAIDGMALTTIAIGSIEGFIRGLRVMLLPSATGNERREVWLRYARWLVAGLTFQLAADIVGASITPTWEQVGRLAAVAAIRTFLSFFLERDLAETRQSEREDRDRGLSK